MKPKKKVVFATAILAMLLCCLFLSGCGCKQHVGVGKCTKCGEDFFTLLQNHCIKVGTYHPSGFYINMFYPDEDNTFSLGYDAETDEIMFMLDHDTYSLFIYMKKIDGRYDYTLDTGKYTMEGMINAALLSTISNLSYDHSSAPYYMNSVLSEMACAMAKLWVIAADRYFEEYKIPITSANLGFVE